MQVTRYLAMAAAAVLLAGAGVSTRVLAEAATAPAPEHRPPHHPLLHRLERLLGTLNLTDQQKAQIKEILAAFKKDVDAWRAQHQDELQKIHAEIRAAREAKDKEKVQAAMKKLHTLLETAPKPREMLEKIKAVLTPEQKQKFEAELKEIREKRLEHRGEGRKQ